ncbi:WRKY family transcription factor, partial [Tanacetum coccineum]
MAGDTPTPPKPPIDKAYSIASIKACIPTPLDLDKLNYNSWSSLFQRFYDVDSTAHGVWNRLKDLFHDNKDARITQLDNEIRNMAIGNLSITDFFQQLKSKADRLANLESPV